jgi:hypothetical protein
VEHIKEQMKYVEETFFVNVIGVVTDNATMSRECGTSFKRSSRR